MAGARVCVQTTQMSSAGRVQVSQGVHDFGVQTQVVKTVDEQHRNVLGPDLWNKRLYYSKITLWSAFNNSILILFKEHCNKPFQPTLYIILFTDQSKQERAKLNEAEKESEIITSLCWSRKHFTPFYSFLLPISLVWCGQRLISCLRALPIDQHRD